jgi:DNA-binding MarR family transcriptional regulator
MEVAAMAGKSGRQPSSRRDGMLHEFILPVFSIRGYLVELIEQACGEFDLVSTESVAMLHLAKGRMTVSEISRAAGLQRSGGSVLVERLHERSYVKRAQDPGDRRVVWVSLTPKGAKLAEALLKRIEGRTPDLLANLSADERQRVLTGLQILRDLR